MYPLFEKSYRETYEPIVNISSHRHLFLIILSAYFLLQQGFSYFSGPLHSAPFSYENGAKLIRFCLAFTELFEAILH